eukprot:4205350-Pleurochrysis_carterae.AAC.1
MLIRHIPASALASSVSSGTSVLLASISGGAKRREYTADDEILQLPIRAHIGTRGRRSRDSGKTSVKYSRFRNMPMSKPSLHPTRAATCSEKRKCISRSVKKRGAFADIGERLAVLARTRRSAIAAIAVRA